MPSIVMPARQQRPITEAQCRAGLPAGYDSLSVKYSLSPMLLQSLQNIRIVLVHTTHPGNIGAAARAMRTMGISRLYLVAPRHFPDPEASARAAGGLDVLNNAKVTDTLPEAIADCGLIIGASARQRRIAGPVLTPRESAQQAIAADCEVALVFGREDRGLSNLELQSCNYCLGIPADESYSSLNLAMAVQVAAYELRLAALAGKPPQEEEEERIPPATADELEHLYRHLHETLEAIGFLDPAAPRQLLPRLRRLFTRARLDRMEVGMLRGILDVMHRYDSGQRDK